MENTVHEPTCKSESVTCLGEATLNIISPQIDMFALIRFINERITKIETRLTAIEKKL